MFYFQSRGGSDRLIVQSDCYIIIFLVFFLPLCLTGQEQPTLVEGREDVALSVADRLEVGKHFYQEDYQQVDMDTATLRDAATAYGEARDQMGEPANRPGTLWLVMGKWSLILITLALGAMMLWLNHRRIKRLIKQQDELSNQVGELRAQLSAKLSGATVVEPTTKLNRPKIEAVMDIRLGESAWRIMQLVFANPAISNKEIAQKVNLSLDGVSSSLRRIYAAFGVKGRGNKKVLLTRKIEQIIDGAMNE